MIEKLPLYLVGIGVWLVSDGVYSIVYYCCDGRKESWMRNHIFRVIRMLLGIFLIVAGFVG